MGIKKAEKEIGAPIFNRKTVPFTLTAEGALYIDSIEKVLKIENETKSRIQDIALLKSGTLKIGTATHLSFYAIPKICETSTPALILLSLIKSKISVISSGMLAAVPTT